tara:strand:+ start:5400 stop:6281 length:882 start_codon:yes stop_codon:yes gene_type:complete
VLTVKDLTTLTSDVKSRASGFVEPDAINPYSHSLQSRSLRERGTAAIMQKGHVNSLAEKLIACPEFDTPPILVARLNENCRHEGREWKKGERVICDGIHRITAYRKADRFRVPAIIFPADLVTAKRISMLANVENGLGANQRYDKQKRIQWAHRDPEMKLMSYREIGAVLGIPRSTVHKYSKELGIAFGRDADRAKAAKPERKQVDMTDIMPPLETLADGAQADLLGSAPENPRVLRSALRARTPAQLSRAIKSRSDIEALVSTTRALMASYEALRADLVGHEEAPDEAESDF